MTIILFLVILAVLVFVHELGHFVAAKAFGIRVDEFAIGFPPKIFGWKKGETQYSLNLIPFGGYVKIFGENPDDESLVGADSSRSFVNAKRWKQAIVLLAGIFMNIVFAWILISISFNIGLTTSIQDEYKDKAKDVGVMIMAVQKDSPAEKAGIKEGDYVLSIKSGGVSLIFPSVELIQKTIAESENQITIEYKRNSATGTLDVISKDGVVEGKKAIGISMGLVGTVEFGFFQSFYEGAKLTGIETKNIAVGLYTFIASLFKGQSNIFAQVAGPIGIAGMVGEARSIGISYLLGFVAMISINLAMLNLVPFPALDGGRVLFVGIEAIIRRRIKPAILNWTNGIGFLLLILLMIFVTYKDILRLIK
ncbi:MAG: RIP metalloprotease RseP [Candidatus Paceibacterota bacterium]|jgi:regulator of sigma E protease